MLGILSKYAHWLHGQWPAGLVEKLPIVAADGESNVPGLYVVGDLTGVPLLKFALQSGTQAVRTIVADPSFRNHAASEKNDILDIAILGGGVSGIAAAAEAKKQRLAFKVFEASQAFNTLINFPNKKPIYTYPIEMIPEGNVQVTGDVKEALVEELEQQRSKLGLQIDVARVVGVKPRGSHFDVELDGGTIVKALRVIVAIGRSGNFRTLGVPGETLPKVFNRLHDPKEYTGKNVLVVGGGDSALETAIALSGAHANVTLSYRKPDLARAKPENIEKIKALKTQGKLRLELGSAVMEVQDKQVVLQVAPNRASEVLPNDYVFTMLGREAPLDFFRRAGVRILGETSLLGTVALISFFLFCVFVYTWKSGGPTQHWLDPFPDKMPEIIASLGTWWGAQVADRSTLIGTLAVSLKSRSFYYTLAYSLCVVIFGLKRMKRRPTPYVRVQTSFLMAVQVLPLFVLPELIFPWLGYNGWFNTGFLRTVADNLFELYIPAEQYLSGQWPEWGHPRAYWRAYGFILAWPLMVYNVFTPSPMLWWLIIAFIQTCVIIPGLVYFFGKGAYCGWICSCGALAETLGDSLRHKMPHGPGVNKLNLAGQVILAIVVALLGLRIVGWIWPALGAGHLFELLFEGKNESGVTVNYFSYKWVIDVGLAGIVGVGLYFKYSGRVWCRFFCPLAALMHIYARFTRFRIFSEKKKCISCNVCTSVCHQGIDIMSFANKGIPMEDPECVRCSACVQSCPTGVLSFGRTGRGGLPILDQLSARSH
jgi:NosR/NirI family nitrous oxide reductase transcriptional regulator